MPASIVMGGQWGDEGKGKLTDALAGRAHMVVRANGGSNAGHTVQTSQGTFKLHLVPSGILNAGCVCVIGAGVVIDPRSLIDEIASLEARGVSTDRLVISDRAHVVLPYHLELDRRQETSREDSKIGTTLRGIGPAYADKAARHGIRVGDLIDPNSLRERLQVEVEHKNHLLASVYGVDHIDPASLIEQYRAYGERLAPYVKPAEIMVQDALDSGKQIVVECAQGALLDIDYGTYPYVTSSSPTAAGACQGAGVAPTQVERVIAVYKAYSTRVGGGPFPTELHDESGSLIRERGREYGTTTGRPRRTGWFDGVAARHVARLNGVTEIALTLADVLDTFDSIKLCTSYELDGQRIAHLPAQVGVMARVRPIYEEHAGWMSDSTAVRTAAEVPSGMREYVAAIERAAGAPVTMLGVGPDREQLVPISDHAAMMAVQPA
jgi:adenylosuccinate synthase